MKVDLNAIHNPQVRTLYMLWRPQHRTIRDFYTLLTEEQYDYCMVNTSDRKADTPRESLRHILYVQLIYLSRENGQAGVHVDGLRTLLPDDEEAFAG